MPTRECQPGGGPNSVRGVAPSWDWFSGFAWRSLFGALRKNAEVYADSLGHFLAGDLALLVDGLPEGTPLEPGATPQFSSDAPGEMVHAFTFCQLLLMPASARWQSAIQTAGGPNLVRPGARRGVAPIQFGVSSADGPILGSGSACLRGALCLAPFEKMPRYTRIRSGTSSQVTWRSRSAA